MAIVRDSTPVDTFTLANQIYDEVLRDEYIVLEFDTDREASRMEIANLIQMTLDREIN